MQHSLTSRQQLALGLMTFAFFLGAGNLIFPPMVGLATGTQFLPAIIGFCSSAVGLPLLTLIACAIANGGIAAMAQGLPRTLVQGLMLTVFLILGPLFAAPRAALVSFEVVSANFGGAHSSLNLAIYSSVFFVVVAALAWHRGSLSTVVGKWLTPLLLIILTLLGIAVLFAPLAPITSSAMSKAAAWQVGFFEGYKTMDTFAALMFGMLIIDVLSKQGITEPQLIQRYVLRASFIAATGLGLLYVTLMYLGATSAPVSAQVSNGGQLLSAYVLALFGNTGLWVLAAVLTLACVTAATGLLSACADGFNRQWPKISYQRFILGFAMVSILLANIGLSELLHVAEPLLILLYPLAITLVANTLLKPLLYRRVRTLQFSLLTASVFAVIDVLSHFSLLSSPQLVWLPLATWQLSWLIPTFATLLASVVGKLLVANPPILAVNPQPSIEP